MSKDWETEADNWTTWARTPGHDAYWHYAPKFFEDIVPRPIGLTLEVGCGEGRVSRDLRARGHEVVAIDTSPTLLKAAAAADPESSYLITSGERLPFPSGTFELVVAYNSLMDVDDMPATVAEAGPVLTPQGMFCVCITHPINDAVQFDGMEELEYFIIDGTYYDRKRIEEKLERDVLVMTFHSWRYPLEAYAQAFEKAGFVIKTLVNRDRIRGHWKFALPLHAGAAFRCSCSCASKSARPPPAEIRRHYQTAAAARSAVARARAQPKRRPITNPNPLRRTSSPPRTGCAMF